MIISWKSPFTALRALGRIVWYWFRGWPVIAPKDVIEVRDAICEACDQNDHAEYPQCKACTCWINAKTMASSEFCPLGKWKSLTGGTKKPNTGPQP